MNVKIFITIDTEEDQWEKYKTDSYTINNVMHGIPLIQNIFDKFGALPTYLINYPVATNRNAMRMFQEMLDKGRCEIGTHCHPWNTPPFREQINYYNTMLCNLPHELQYKKIEAIHEVITNHLKVAPISFRAGKWGFGPSVAQTIYQLGYRIDSSITPFTDWTDDDGPDFSKASVFPYRFDPDNVVSKKENGCLLEIPPTIAFLQRNLERCGQIRGWILKGPLHRFHLLGTFGRLRLLNYLHLSPELCKGSEMILLSKNLIKLGCPVLNMFFHSTSLLVGASPFVQTQEKSQKFLDDIQIFLQFAVDQGWVFSPLSAMCRNMDVGSPI
jgi:hypothetical protein